MTHLRYEFSDHECIKFFDIKYLYLAREPLFVLPLLIAKKNYRQYFLEQIVALKYSKTSKLGNYFEGHLRTYAIMTGSSS